MDLEARWRKRLFAVILREVQNDWNFIFKPPQVFILVHDDAQGERYVPHKWSQWDEMKSYLRMSQTPFDQAPTGL